MNNVGVRFPDWDLNKSQYVETDTFPLMATLGPVLMILATYLVFILKIGPAVMTKREPYKLSNVLLIYNTVQVLFSCYLVQKYFRFLWSSGLTPTKCYMTEENDRKEILFNIWLYFAAKVSELLDTVFFVLRKKFNQVTFLHLYHHSIMMIGTWSFLKYWPSHTLIFIGFLNSLVHVFMYTYYGLAALDPNVSKYKTWKKYMTRFQLVQFMCMIVQYTSAVVTSDCPPSKGPAIFVACNTAFFLVLFLNFYRQSYTSKKAKTIEVKNVNGCNYNSEKCIKSS